MRRSIIAIFALFVLVVLLSFPASAQTSLQNYCKDGYYQIQGEKKCSRAPKCGGKTYDELNKAEFMPNNNDCLDEGHGMIIGDPPASSAFYGYVPLCCYEMVRLKDPEMCIGYWERLWCHPDQCSQIDNAHGCGGGGCNCGHAMKTWCETRHCNLLPPVPVENRIKGTAVVPTKPAPTRIPTVTLPSLYPTTPPLLPTKSVPSPIPSLPPTIPLQKPTNMVYPTSTPTPLQGQNIDNKKTLRLAVIKLDSLLQSLRRLMETIRQSDQKMEIVINTWATTLIQNLTHPKASP